MSPILQLLLQLSILITAAKLAGLLSTKLGQPTVVSLPVLHARGHQRVQRQA